MFLVFFGTLHLGTGYRPKGCIKVKFYPFHFTQVAGALVQQRGKAKGHRDQWPALVGIDRHAAITFDRDTVTGRDRGQRHLGERGQAGEGVHDAPDRAEQADERRGGADGGAPDADDYADALGILVGLEDVSIVAAPGYSAFYSEASPSTYQAIQDALLTHVADPRRYRMAVLDAPPSVTPGQMRELRGLVDSTRAALYYPWIVASNPLAGPNSNQPAEIALPPSGHVCGIYARNDIANDEDSALATLDDPSTRTITGETYGGLKAACERAAQTALPDRTSVVRPGLIVALERGPEVIVPTAARA